MLAEADSGWNVILKILHKRLTMKTTNDLMNKLKTEVSDERALKEYLEKNTQLSEISSTSFAEYFSGLLHDKGITNGEIERQTGLEHAFCNKMINGKVGITRNNMLALSIAAGLNLDEIEKCLVLTNNGALYPKDSRDAIIIYSINRGLTLAETNSLLYSKGMELLGQCKE